MVGFFWYSSHIISLKQKSNGFPSGSQSSVPTSNPVPVLDGDCTLNIVQGAAAAEMGASRTDSGDYPGQAFSPKPTGEVQSTKGSGNLSPSPGGGGSQEPQNSCQINKLDMAYCKDK